MLRLALGLAVMLLACGQISAQRVSPHARQAAQTIRELRSIGLPESDQLQNGPPANVPGLLRQLNHQLRDLVTEILNDQTRRAVPSEDEVIAELRAAGWDEIPDHKWNSYGEIVEIHFDWKVGYDPGILIVSTQLWIPCGSRDPDSAVYLFQGRAREWNLSLAADADFDFVNGSQESGMQYQLSPPNANGGWFLAIAHAPPSCRSVPGFLRYKIVRPGRSADEPITLLNRREPINQHFDPPFRLRTETDWFAVTRGKIRKLDGEPGVSISRYEVSGGQIRRIQPLALTPEDFLDEWSQLAWNEAARWSNESLQPDLKNWHSKFNSLADDSIEMEFVQLCPKEKGSNSSWLLGLWIDQEQNPSARDERLYITVSKRDGALYVDGIRTTRPGGCPGTTPVPMLTDSNLPDW